MSGPEHWWLTGGLRAPGRRQHGSSAHLSEPGASHSRSQLNSSMPCAGEAYFYLEHSHELTVFRRKTTQICQCLSPPLGSCIFLRAKGSPVDADHTGAWEMIDLESFAEMTADVGIVLSWTHSLCTGLLGVCWGLGGGIPNEGSFYANTAVHTDQVSASLC